jgi:hypothetical protein
MEEGKRGSVYTNMYEDAISSTREILAYSFKIDI